MATAETATLTVTIDAPYERVARDLADPVTHPEWAHEFFSGPTRRGEGDEVVVPVPLMGGDARFRIESDLEHGILDLYLAPLGAELGPPLPVRLVPNLDGVDVLWTLSRPPGLPDEPWRAGCESMQRELESLRARHERGPSA